MAELIQKERLQPSLLDRLTDNARDRNLETVQERVLNLRQLRRGVLRDLAWLFNSPNLECASDLRHFPLVARSVLNFGVPAVSGRAASGVTQRMLEEMMREAILRFEPRILPHTVRVRAVVAADQMNRNAVGFEVEGELWSQPVPIHLLLKTEMDLETGRVSVQDSGVSVTE